jgi:hypothetical protein
MADTLAQRYLADIIVNLERQKTLAERAIEQVRDEELFAALGDDDNSIAILVKHIAGNMRSRWTDFLTTDGEKPNRDRDSEFEMSAATTRAGVLEWWSQGWDRTFATIRALSPSDLERTVAIRGERMSVLEAIDRALVHYAQHVGQIVMLAKYFRGPQWKSLSIPKAKR